MKYDKEDLYETNMHSLRNIAREIGVYAPTRLKKKELIHEILQIESGEKLPCKPTKKGRPVKNDLKSRKVEAENTVENKNTVEEDEKRLKGRIKKEFIDTVLRELEKKLNKLL